MNVDFDGLPPDALRRRYSRKWRDVGGDALPAWVAEMDIRLAPVIERALVDAIALGDTSYSPHTSIELGEAFSAFAARHWGWLPDPSSVATVPDLFSAMVEVLHVIDDPRPGVAMFVPAYPPFYQVVHRAGRELRPIRFAPDAAGWALDENALDAALRRDTAVLVLNNPHNPTGKSFRRSELEIVLGAARRHRVFVISDEIHAPLTYREHAHVP